jgi:type IV pilus assembly protein PilF
MNRSLDLRPLGATIAAALGLAAVASGCAPESKSPQAASPERQAVAEYDLARDAFYKGHLREALDHQQRSNSLDDANPKSLYFTAVVYLAFCSTEGMKSPDCRLKDAERFARKAIDAESDFRDARNTLGQILILEENYAEAMKVLEPLTRDPAYVANYLAWGNYGWAQVKAGKIDEGISSLRNSITEPRFCTGDYRLGVAYEKKGDFDAAEKSFTDAVEVPSEDCEALQDAWYERATVRMKLGNSVAAQRDYARCREIGPKSETGRLCAKLAGDAAPSPLAPIKKPGAPENASPGSQQQAADAGRTTSAQ